MSNDQSKNFDDGRKAIIICRLFLGWVGKYVSFLNYLVQKISRSYLILLNLKLEVRLKPKLRQVRHEPRASCEAFQPSQHGAWQDVFSPEIWEIIFFVDGTKMVFSNIHVLNFIIFNVKLTNIIIHISRLFFPHFI